MHDDPRTFKPLWRWELLLFALVLVLAIAANLVLRIPSPAVSGVLSVVLLVLAVALAAALIVPLITSKGRDSENTLRSVEGRDLVLLESVGETPVTVRVEESERRQTSIDAARAKSRLTPKAVLTPDASRWLGRELRVAVDLVADDGRVYRAGFVPRRFGATLRPALLDLRSRGEVAVVPVEVSGGGDRARLAVDVRL